MAESTTENRSVAQASPPEVEGEGKAADTETQFVRVLSWGLPIVTVASAVTVHFVYDTGLAILVMAGGVLLGVIAILWASVRTLSGDSPITLEEALALGAPSAAEEQKRAVLQALKDLEYERSVGKIGEADYADLLHRYRTQAKRLLRAVDEDLAPLRARAAAYVAERLEGKSEAPRAAPKEKVAKTEPRAC
ncbi:MAG TPA: hypothetical protein VJT73_15080, partial [Polyangiaceae bacterium]|nr:hypothetical protein [Polyangiaceae bacterium]